MTCKQRVCGVYVIHVTSYSPMQINLQLKFKKEKEKRKQMD